MSIFERVQDIFRDVFDDDNLVILPEMTADDIEEWDSIAQMNLIVAMSKEFNIKFSVEEIAQLHNVGEMVALVEKRVK